MSSLNIAYLLSLPPQEAIDFINKKIALSPELYKELLNETKREAFSVAGIYKLEVLANLKDLLAKALTNGTTFQEFKKNFEEQNPGLINKEGEPLLPKYRLQTIFQTNIMQAYSIARYNNQLKSAKHRPYWQYIAVMDSKTRLSHAKLHLTVRRYDDPFWQTYYPPNGFNCRCRVRSLSEADIKSMNLTVETPLREGETIQGITPANFFFSPSPANGGVPSHGIALSTLADKIPVDVTKHIADEKKQIQENWGSTFKPLLTGMLSGETMPTDAKPVLAGYITPEIKQALKRFTEIESLAVYANTKGIAHAFREGKRERLSQQIQRGAGLTEQEILSIPEYIANYHSVYWEPANKAILFMYQLEQQSAFIKVVVKPYSTKDKQLLNLFKTAGVIPDYNINSKDYIPIKKPSP